MPNVLSLISRSNLFPIALDNNFLWHYLCNYFLSFKAVILRSFVNLEIHFIVLNFFNVIPCFEFFFITFYSQINNIFVSISWLEVIIIEGLQLYSFRVFFHKELWVKAKLHNQSQIDHYPIFVFIFMTTKLLIYSCLLRHIQPHNRFCNIEICWCFNLIARRFIS